MPGTLGEAVDAYKAILDAEEGKTPKWKRDLYNRITLALAPLGRDLALASLDHDAVARVTGHFVGRLRAGTLAAKSAAGYLAAAKMFLTWLDASTKFAWSAPKGMPGLFRIPVALARTQKDPRVLSIDQLRLLYQNADDRVKLWMVLSLNCGANMSDLSSMSADMVKMVDGVTHLERPRHKTGVAARWRLWDETRDLLAKVPLAGLNQNIIKNAWYRLRVACGLQSVRAAAFKGLRSTAAQLVRDASDRETAEAFLAHTEQGVGASYHKHGRQDLLDTAIMKVREQLDPVFK
jgi:hypothetical protein